MDGTASPPSTASPVVCAHCGIQLAVRHPRSIEQRHKRRYAWTFGAAAVMLRCDGCHELTTVTIDPARATAYAELMLATLRAYQSEIVGDRGSDRQPNQRSTVAA